MSCITILTEKPSVARDFAKALGAKQKDGYYEAQYKNNTYFITWAFGHLFEIDDAVAPKKWSWDTLPIIPQDFKYKIISESHAKQFKLIKDLLNRSDMCYLSSDAGQEGELLGRIILHQAKWNKWNNTYRFWTSEALTKEVILKNLEKVKPISEFNSLYFAGLSRSHGDWLVGINLTRAITLKANTRDVWSIGRVQTPILAIIVKRDLERENFKPQEYYTLTAQFSYGNFSYQGTYKNPKDNEKAKEDEENKKNKEQETGSKLTKEQAMQIYNDIKDEKTAKVISFNKQRKAQNPPLLHSLTTLQREANELYSFSANKTLKIAQELYEAKLISYPRTDANYLAESSKDLVKEILEKFNKDLISNVDKVGKRVFDDSKLTDHYAVIPQNTFKDLSEDHKKVYDLVLRRFLGAFMEPYIYDEYKIITNIKNYSFYTTISVPISLGWKELYDNNAKPIQVSLQENANVNVNEVKTNQKFTEPPAYYTEASILKVMEKLNLGTPATRASIIETLKTRNYIEVKKKSLISTPKGRELIKQIANSEIANPIMTANWEKFLQDIYKNKRGKTGYDEFIDNIKKLVEKELNKIEELNIERPSFGKCKCGGSIQELPKSYQCSQCKTTVWKETFGKKLPINTIQDLFQGNKVLVKGLKSKAGKDFDAYLIIKDSKVVIDGFPNKK